MHIPDGFLDLKTGITTYLASGVTLTYTVKKVRRDFAERDIPLLGLLGAFIFAAQMINLPIAAGTSGHLMGGVLALLVVGPWAASLVMSAILIVQAVFFMDGGVAVLGANIFNIAVIQVFSGYLFYIILKKVSPERVSIFLAAFLATVISSVFTALELAFSGAISLSLVLPAMVGWHLLIGLFEGLLTVLVVSYLRKTAPERLAFIKNKGVGSNV